MKNHKKTTALLAALLTVAVASANATLSDAQSTSLKSAFQKNKKAEVPAWAAKVVQQAPAAQKVDWAVAVVDLAVKKYPALAPAVVSSISQVAHEVAPAVAAEAAKLTKEHARAIAEVAAKAAPENVDQIAGAVNGVLPASSQLVVAKARTSGRSAAGASVAGTSTVTPGSISGNYYFLPPTPSPQPVQGYDPNRYVSP